MRFTYCPPCLLGYIVNQYSHKVPQTVQVGHKLPCRLAQAAGSHAGWRSPVSRKPHKLEISSSNLLSATKDLSVTVTRQSPKLLMRVRLLQVLPLFVYWFASVVEVKSFHRDWASRSRHSAWNRGVDGSNPSFLTTEIGVYRRTRALGA